MVKKALKSFHTGTIKRTVRINTSKEKVWRKISNIVGLPTWVVNVKETTYLSKKKKDVGAIRLITFVDGTKIEEHVVAWKKEEYFTYVATEGLPLRAYVATISIKNKTKNITEITWQSYSIVKKCLKNNF